MRKLLLSILLLALAGCSSYSKVVEAESVEGEWALIHASVDGESVSASSLPDRFVIRFDAPTDGAGYGQISGRSACNSLYGAYRITPRAAIQFENVLATRVWCGEENAVAEQAIFQLERAGRYELSGETLGIEFAAGSLLLEKVGR